MNKRASDINEAADRAIKKVLTAYSIDIPHFDTDAYQNLFLTITDDLASRFEKSYRWTLDDLVSEAREEEAAIRMGHLDQGDFIDQESGEELPTKREKLEAVLEGALSELRVVHSHRCYFDENDYCPVCRADGRA